MAQSPVNLATTACTQRAANEVKLCAIGILIHEIAYQYRPTSAIIRSIEQFLNILQLAHAVKNFKKQ